MKILDMHCDTILECLVKDCGLRENDLHIDLMKLKKGGALGQFFALWIPTEKDAAEYGVKGTPKELFYLLYDRYVSEMEKNSDLILPAYSYQDILDNEKAGKLSSILTIEDSTLLEGDLSVIDEVYEKGVRLMTLIWNHENTLAYPNSMDNEIHMKGLKPFGIEAVEYMNEKGIIVDVSHLNEGGFYDVARYSKKPFVASHSCARALSNVSRNLTDDQLKVLGEKGGVVGVNFDSEFLTGVDSHTEVADIVRNIDYMVGKAGIESVGIGTDYDGIICPLEVANYGMMDLLVNALEKKYKADDLEKICYKNTLRIVREVL